MFQRIHIHEKPKISTLQEMGKQTTFPIFKEFPPKYCDPNANSFPSEAWTQEGKVANFPGGQASISHPWLTQSSSASCSINFSLRGSELLTRLEKLNRAGTSAHLSVNRKAASYRLGSGSVECKHRRLLCDDSEQPWVLS